MRLLRRTVEVFSLSFLDCICCGFGAIILLLVLTEYGDPIQLAERTRDLTAQARTLEADLRDVRRETGLVNRQLQPKLELLEKERRRLARLAGDLTSISGESSASKKEATVTNVVEGELVSAYQTLTAEMQRLLKEQASRPKTEAIGGIPVDSEYVIFVQDTSSSMDAKWQLAVTVMQEILDMYPRVKGMQIISDQAHYMFEGTRGRWLEDTPERRQEIVSKMKTWRPFSFSNPVSGILEALKTYSAPDKRISIYVLGDEYTGNSIQFALDAIGRLNKTDPRGRRAVRIHAIGYLDKSDKAPLTSLRFAALMRFVCAQNDGTFVALTRD